MAARDPELRACNGRIMAARRWGTDDDVTAARRELHEARLKVAIRRELDKAPPLSAEQRARLAALLAPQAGDTAA